MAGKGTGTRPPDVEEMLILMKVVLQIRCEVKESLWETGRLMLVKVLEAERSSYNDRPIGDREPK